MEIKIRAVTHTPDEIQMGQVIFYRPLPEADGISVTANVTGFTTLTAVTKAWQVDLEHARRIADHANNLPTKYTWTLVLEEPIKHCLIFVPKTKGETDSTAMTSKLLEDAEMERIQVLEFSHFNFIQKIFPSTEIESALRIIGGWKNPLPTTMIFDVDARFAEIFQETCRKLGVDILEIKTT